MTVRPQPNGGFVWVQAAAGPALVCRALRPLALHIFTTRAWRLGGAGSGADDGWTDVSAALDVEPINLARLHQVHGSTVVVAAPGGTAHRPSADIVITDDAAKAVAVQTADCVPLLMADTRTGAVAAAHAGWRGLAARVPQIAVDALTRQFGSAPADLIVAVGPSIGACCYEVGADVRDAFVQAGFEEGHVRRWFFDLPQPTAMNPSIPALSSTRRAQHWFLDGWRSARDQLHAAGVPDQQIHIAALCTASHQEILCSYRRDGKGAGRMAAAIKRKKLEVKS